MILSIDTTVKNLLVIFLDNNKYEKVVDVKKGQELLPFIEETIKSEGKSIKELTEIKVNIGPGSFTGIKVGVAVAQTLGWVLKIPVNGKDITKEQLVIHYE